MTCIVGIETPRGVLLGGDSAATGGWDLTVRADEKVFARGEFVFGFTSSFRMGQLLRYGDLNPDTRKADEDPDRFMCVDFVDAVRSLLKAGGYAKVSNGEESGGTFLVGFRGRLYAIHDDFQVARPADSYDACGSGASIALGAMFASAGDPERRVRGALAAAERHSAGVRGPFHVVRGVATT